jgi:hypothetical protein
LGGEPERVVEGGWNKVRAFHHASEYTNVICVFEFDRRPCIVARAAYNRG